MGKQWHTYTNYKSCLLYLNDKPLYDLTVRISEFKWKQDKARDLLRSRCFDVKFAVQPRTMQKTEAAIFRRRLACSWLASEICLPRGRFGRVTIRLDSSSWGGWSLPVRGTLTSCCSECCRGGLQKKLNSSAKFYKIDQRHSRYEAGKEKLTRSPKLGTGTRRTYIDISRYALFTQRRHSTVGGFSGWQSRDLIRGLIMMSMGQTVAWVVYTEVSKILGNMANMKLEEE